MGNLLFSAFMVLTAVVLALMLIGAAMMLGRLFAGVVARLARSATPHKRC